MDSRIFECLERASWALHDALQIGSDIRPDSDIHYRLSKAHVHIALQILEVYTLYEELGSAEGYQFEA